MTPINSLRKVKRVSDIRYHMEDSCRRQTTVDLELEISGRHVTIRGKMIKSRYSKEDSFLLIQPLDNALEGSIIPSGLSVKMAFSTSRGYFRLGSDTIGLESEGLRLEYPKELEVIQRRNAVRVYFERSDEFRVSCRGEEGEVEALVLSLSANGFSCVQDSKGRELRGEEHLSQITLYLPSGGEVYSTGVVRDVVPEARMKDPAVFSPSPGKVGNGKLYIIVLDQISTENHLRLIRFISGAEAARARQHR